MLYLLTRLYNDENGFVVSAELILVVSILVLGVIVGMAELSWNVNEELEDVGSAFGEVNQGYVLSSVVGHKAAKAGSRFRDYRDLCDSQFDLICTSTHIPSEILHH